MDIQNMNGKEYLHTIEDDSVDLVLTDPPYIISRDSGMDKHYEHSKPKCTKTEEEWLLYSKDIQSDKKLEDFKLNYMTYGNIYGDCSKTEEQWLEYSNKTKLKQKMDKTKDMDKAKDNYLKYGTIYGKKYAVKTNYGNWDESFTMDELEYYIETYYKKLKKGGTLIIFFDLWKIETLKDILEKYKFKQIRMIEWIKTNPQPLNSKVNYLTNCREIALVAVKGSKPTFHSEYDKGVYEYAFPGGKKRFHPTQKSLPLFEDLIKKHSNEGDIVMDTFLGSGTTYYACKNTERTFKGCELNKEYFDKIIVE
jgi:DNA modification methylase